MTCSPNLPEVIRRAIKTGDAGIPEDLMRWKALVPGASKKTKAAHGTFEPNLGDKVLAFSAGYLIVPEGPLIGKPLELDEYQAAFVYAVFGPDTPVKKAILSVARRNGKTLVIGAVLWAYILGPAAVQNSVVACTAMSKDQAKLAFRLMKLMAGPKLEGRYRIVDSKGQIFGLNKNVELITLSREAKTGHGRSIRVLLIDEAGQIEAPNDDYLDMLFTSQGSYDDAITFIISTQAPTDAAFLSAEIDAATTNQPKGTVCHVYAADADADINDPEQWAYANPGLGKFRSLSDMEKLAQDAKLIPSKQTGFKNLNLNQRVTQHELAFAPEAWRACNAMPSLDVFRNASSVCVGIDLSQKSDLTAAVVAAKDDEGRAHLLVYPFAPEDGLHQRSIRDKTPYDVWAREGVLHLCPGGIIGYDFVFSFLTERFLELGINPTTIAYDRWRMVEAKHEAERANFAPNAEWLEWGQGFQSMTVAIERFEDLLLRGKICHGDNPALNASAMTAVVAYDAAGNRKLEKGDGKKNHSHRRRIDPLQAALMAVAPLAVAEVVDVSLWISPAY